MCRGQGKGAKNFNLNFEVSNNQKEPYKHSETEKKI